MIRGSRCSLIVTLYEPPGNASCEDDEHLRTLEAHVRVEPEEADNSLARMLGLN